MGAFDFVYDWEEDRIAWQPFPTQVMMLGQSFWVPADQVPKARLLMARINRRGNMRLAARSMHGGLMIWQVELDGSLTTGVLGQPVPPLPDRGNTARWPLQSLQVGEWVETGHEGERAMRAAAYQSNYNRKDKRFEVHKIGDKVRCTRVF